MAPSPVKLVEPLIDFAELFVDVVDDEGEGEVDVEVDDDEVEEVVVKGTEK